MVPDEAPVGFISPPADYEVLQGADPRAVLKWVDAAAGSVAVATSFQSSGLVILHLMKEIRPRIQVLFLETGFHFPETLAFRDRIAELWDLNLTNIRGPHGSADAQAVQFGPELYRRDPDRCCFINKVAPLQEALEGYDAWVSGIRRDQSPLRAETPVVEAQLLPSGREVLKVHPLATWSKEDVTSYIREHDIPTHPLLERGFTSIGCWPCTRTITPGESERAGRWDAFEKTECGIHSFGKLGGRASEAEQ